MVVQLFVIVKEELLFARKVAVSKADLLGLSPSDLDSWGSSPVENEMHPMANHAAVCKSELFTGQPGTMLDRKEAERAAFGRLYYVPGGNLSSISTPTTHSDTTYSRVSLKYRE